MSESHRASQYIADPSKKQCFILSLSAALMMLQRIAQSIVLIVVTLLTVTTMHAAESVEAIASKAIAAINRGEYDLAVTMSKTGLKTWPRDPNLLNIAAVGFNGINQQDSAIAYSLKAIAAAPAFVPAYVSYAAASSKLKAWDDVVEYCDRGLELNANESTLSFLRQQARNELRMQVWSRLTAVFISLLLVLVLVMKLRFSTSGLMQTSSLAALGAAGLVSLIHYHVFFALSDVIWSFKHPLSIADVLPHVRGFVLERDGIEGYVLFAQTILSILFAVLLGKASNALTAPIWQRSILVVAVAATIVYIVTVGVYPPQAAIIEPFSDVLPMLIGVATITALIYVLHKYVPRVGTFVVAILLFACCYVASEPISLVDYSFILAPAIRMLQGAQIHDIYLQYDLLPSLISAVWLKLELRLETVEIIGQTAMFICMIGAFGFSRSLFRDQRLPVIFLVTMLIIRIYANMHNPTALLQVTSLRLDWWLLLAALAYYRGAFDWTLGAALGVLLIVHKNFAIIYLACYTLFCAVLAFQRLRDNSASAGSWAASIKFTVSEVARVLWPNVTIILGALCVNLVIFGSILPESALLYQKLGLGMLPVDRHSFYWLVAMVLPTVFLMASHLRKSLPRNYVETSIFLVFLAAGSLMYFFGRSHENNLLNISSILVLLIFLLLDLLGIRTGISEPAHGRKETSSRTTAPFIRLRSNVGFILGLALLTSAVVHYSGTIASRVESQAQNLRNGRFHMPPKSASIDVDALRRLAAGSSGIYVLDFKNDFLYYTLGGFQMPGFFNPCGAWVMKADLAAHIDSLLQRRTTVIAQDLIQQTELLAMTKHNFSKLDNGLYAFTNESSQPMLPTRPASMIDVVIPRPLGDAAVYRTCTPPDDTFTIEFMLKPTSSETPGSRVLTMLGGGKLGIVMQTAADRPNSYLLGIGNGSAWKVPFVLHLLPDQWHHVVLGFNATRMLVNVSGNVVYEGPVPTSFKQTPMQLTIGRPPDVSEFFKGDIRDVVVGNW
ncbi:MAG: LamG domain-containing protein [Candidatus Kapabacteria bacterium]|nr:LamG domain-containing protein [Candidatus Kapabacteria bacterium]